MKILILGLNFAPELTGVGRYTADFVAWLSERGHEVRVMTAPPYYPEWRVGAGYAARGLAARDHGSRAGAALPDLGAARADTSAGSCTCCRLP